jgi:tetratricopeptide (TPR) repeat protein
LELHPEAGLVRAIGIGALVQWLFTGSPGTLGNAGSFLAQIAYNRGFEREADAIALRLLRDAKISPTGFAGFFRRVDGQRPGAKGGSSPARDLFDTHPSTPERIRTIEAAAGYAATPALAPEQWFALQAICRPASSAPGGSATTPNAPAGDPMAAANARITQAPQMAASWYERGELHMTAGRFTEAESDFARAATLEPNNAHFHYRRGTALQDLRRYPDAIDAYTKAVQLNARHAQALAGRGAVHRILRNNAESERDLTAALGVNPRQQYALYQRGLLYGERKEWAAAERDFTTVIEGNRGYAYAYVRRAEAHEGQNNRTAAIADYRAALAAAPSSPNADEAFRIARQRLTALGQAQ